MSVKCERRIFVVGCCFYVLLQCFLLRLAVSWSGDANNFPTLEYDSPHMRVEFHHHAGKGLLYHLLSHLGRRDRVLMIQYFPTTNFSSSLSSPSSGNNAQQDNQIYTRQVNNEYGKYWNYDSVQIMGAVNKSASLLEILDNLHEQLFPPYYKKLLLLPNEGILLNDFLIDVSATPDSSKTVRRFHDVSDHQNNILVHSYSTSYCYKTNDDNRKEAEQYKLNSNLIWNEGMTLWSIPSTDIGSRSFVTQLRSFLSSGQSSYDDDNNIKLSCFPEHFLGQMYCDAQYNPRETPPKVTWYNYSKTWAITPVTSKQLKHKQHLLIGQYSGYGMYGKLLDITSKISRLYCQIWGCDVLVIQGKPWTVPPLDRICPSPEHRSSFAKLTLLHTALSNSQYDQLLLLDADALVYDWDYDVTHLLTSIEDDRQSALPMMTGQMIPYDTENYTWNVNNGVTLWNLRHHMTKTFADQWDLSSSAKILQVAWNWRTMTWSKRIGNKEFDQRYTPRRVGDQETMHNTLRKMDLSNYVYGSLKVMEYDDGTVIKHLKRRNNKQWGNVSDAEYRYRVLKQFSQELCDRFPTACNSNI